ncbi:helix-turn-helix domain-containing protein [Pantoea sp. UYEF8]|uniref:helix-turn-helix domain-containing protein n=1 Tax=Pantoea sp. UYEF8 TaxID=1756394 RepID=UPI0033975590
MSVTLMTKAMSIKVGNPIRKLVLIKLADNANDKGECWPSYQHIADQCEIGRSTVKSHIKELENMGLVRREFRKNGVLNQSNLFHITLDKPVEVVSKVDSVREERRETSGADSDRGGSGADRGVGQHLPGVGQELTGVGQELTGGEAGAARGGGAGADPITSHSFEPVKEPKNITPVADATNAECVPRSRYAFEGNIVKLNHADFASWQKLYANVDLVYELQKLDIEFSHEKPKNWFITASQKLSYQNKQGVWRCQPPPDGANQPHWNDLSEWENNFL